MHTENLAIPGQTIACKIWGNPQNPAILALHGWLDNANSFDAIAKQLQDDYYVIAIDLPGHGHSSHLPPGCNYHFIDAIFTLIEVLNALQLSKVHLLGHSMGACLASIAAGVTPERFLSVALIEGLGPFSHPANTACQQLTNYANYLTLKHNKKPKGYDQFDKAAQARAAAGRVSLDIAQTLCERGVIAEDGMFRWRHDRRLLVASPLRMTEPQILSCLKQVTAKTYLILATQGFAFDSKLMNKRTTAVKNLSIEQLEGGHHIHMEQPDLISKRLAVFFQNI